MTLEDVPSAGRSKNPALCETDRQTGISRHSQSNMLEVSRMETRSESERNLGPQPIAQLMATHVLKTGDLVDASTEHITRKMVVRACKGRWLTPNVKSKVLRALNKAAGKEYSLSDLFTY